MDNDQRLGQNLAKVKANCLSLDLETPTIGKEGDSTIIELVEKWTLLNNTDKALEIITQIPLKSCPVNQPFMTNNIDFFVALLLVNPAEKNCQQLFKHLNDCYHCAKIFANVIRAFYLGTREFKENESGE
ncbi:MAG: hypothetical protein KDH95_09215 [Calditrichaeota bacterium]|nr:hypothetical protein [Calditrichota bacterium]MCB0268332.1 hypothetical protein [Calditrichota bacterium]